MNVNLKFARPKSYKGFTLAEMLTALIVISVMIAVTMPVFTMRKSSEARIDAEAQECVVKENGDSSKAICAGAIDRCKRNVMNTCGTLERYVDYEDNGTDNDELSSLRILRDTCEEGGKNACDTFIDRCIREKNLCDLTDGPEAIKPDGEMDLQYFLKQPIESSNLGTIYIYEQIDNFYRQGVPQIVDAVIKSCENGADSGCALLVNYCTQEKEAAACEALITGCNNGHEGACKHGYINNLNRSCLDIKNILNTNDNKPYGLSYDVEGTNSNAYCDMTNDGGGWTLLIKANGSSENFDFNSLLWTSDNTLNDDETDLTKGASDHTADEHKNLAFSHVPFDQIKIVFHTPITNNDGKTLLLDISGNNLKSLFQGGTIEKTVGISTWASFISPSSTGSSLQKNCHREGLNAMDDIAKHARVRIGIIGNQESNCHTPDSYIGVGGTYDHWQYNKPVTVGNYCDKRYSCYYFNGSGNPTSKDNTGKNVASFAYIYIK